MKVENFILKAWFRSFVIWGIVIVIVFVAIDPITRLQDSRDLNRMDDISSILAIIRLDYIDNGGFYAPSIKEMAEGDVYMIGTDSINCDLYTCDTAVTHPGACVDLTDLTTEGYMSAVPVSPNGDSVWSSGHTGYTLQKNSTGIVVRACESENTPEISVSH